MIDAHCHLDAKLGAVDHALATLHREAKANGVTQVFLMNIPGQSFGGPNGFENAEVLRAAAAHGDFFQVFPEIDPKTPSAAELLSSYRALGAAGLKLHPRLRSFNVLESSCVTLVQKAGELGMPVMVCAFPDGLNLKLGNDAARFAALAELTPKTRIAIGHAGGHHILDFLMAAKTWKNLYLDLSFSPLYYRRSSVPGDLTYAVGCLRRQRVFWGTDHPDRPYAETVTLSADFLAQVGDDGFLAANAQEFLRG